jgi:hypothetical protein
MTTTTTRAPLPAPLRVVIAILFVGAALGLYRTVRGSMSEPQVRPDTTRLLEEAAGQQLREEGKEIEKELKKKLEDKLKDLLGQ